MNNKEEITVKKTTTENNPLKQNSSEPQKSNLKKNKLLIILLSILVCVIIVSTILSLIFIGRKKDDTRVIVEIKREIDQIDYYYLTKKQKTDLEYKNKEKLRNLDDEIVKDSNLIITNSLISVNTFDIVKDKEGRNIYKSFIIIKELNLTDENQNEGNLISLNFDELNEKDLDDINNIPLIQVEFYKDGTIINEYVPKNLNESYLNLLEYSKEKLIPLVSESLYKKDNLRTLENSEEELSYEENKNENSIILKKGLNKQVYVHGNVMKDSINKGNMSTTIINGIIQKIDLNASVSFTTNDNEENIEKDKTFIQLPYQKISSDFSSNFNFIKSDKNKKITNNFKNLVKKVSLVNKNILDKKNNENEEEVKESEENSNLRRLLFSNSIFNSISTESTIFSTYFLGLYYRLYVRTQTDLKNGLIYSFLYLRYGGVDYLLNSQKDYTNINISELQKKIMNSAIAYKTDTQNYGNNFLNKLKNLKSSIESNLQSINNRIEKCIKNCQFFEVIDKFENNQYLLDEFLQFNKDDSAKNECQDEINKINTSDVNSQTKSLVKNFKSNIENKFTGQTPSITSYSDPYSKFNDLNKNSEKEVTTLTTEAQQYFGAKRNLRNLEINNIEDDELLRDLSQISLASGNPLVSGILQDFDKMSYEYYLFVNYLSRKYTTNCLLQTKTYEIPNDLSSKDKTKIEKIYSNANSLINFSLAKCNKLREEVLKEISDIIKEIYKITLPNAKLKTYNSTLSNWQQIFKGISNNSVQSSLSKKKETMFKEKKGHDYTYDLDFNVEGKINELQLNIKPNIIFYPQDLSITFNIDVDANLDFVIEGFIRPKGVKASFNLKNLTYNFVNVLDFKNFENTYKRKLDFSPFNLNLNAYKQNYFLGIKTSKSTIFNDKVECLPSGYWYYFSNIENKSKWENREKNDFNLLVKKEYWIDDNFL